MPILAKSSGGGDFENPKAGTYIARCYKLIDIGTQEESFLGKPSASKRKLYMWLELLEDEDGKEYRMADGQPFSILQRYTLSTFKQATLRKHIDEWRGKPLTKEEAEEFDVEKLLGKYCKVRLSLDESNDHTYVNIKDLSHTGKKPKGVKPESSWSIDKPDMGEFAKFPEWLQIKINGSQEWTAQDGGVTVPKSGTITKGGDVVLEDLDDDPVDLDDVEF